MSLARVQFFSISLCQLVISEGLSDGATYGSVRVVNPFRELTGPDELPG
jgi:predicted nucleic acid-binding protein